MAAASLAGLEFSAADSCGCVETQIIQVEEHCGRLAEQQQFLRPAGDQRMAGWDTGGAVWVSTCPVSGVLARAGERGKATAVASANGGAERGSVRQASQ